MPIDDDWTKQFWQWCGRLIPNDPAFREYVEIEISEDYVNLTFYSTRERFQLTASAPNVMEPKGGLQLIMVDDTHFSAQWFLRNHVELGNIGGVVSDLEDKFRPND